MEAINKHQQTLNQFSLKIATKFLLSISIFSIILSYPSILQSPMQLLSYNIDKNYMFLLCNGILVLIFKDSGLITKSQQDTLVDGKYSMKNGNGQQQVVIESSHKKASVAEEKVVMEVDKAQDEGEEEPVNDEFLDKDEGIELLSIEELNKKCEDFIRKMKEGIKFEAQ